MNSVTLVVLMVTALVAHAAKLPSTFKRCSKSDPKFDVCLAAAIEDAIGQLKVAATDLGLKSLDPLLISELVIGQGTGPVNVQQNFKNIRLHGLTGSKILYHKYGLDENRLFAQSVTPMLRLEADYEMNGRILLLPIFGEGPCNVTLINTAINHTLTGEVFTRKGKNYFRFNDFSVTLRPERVSFKFDNLFNGNQQLGDEINRVLNDNWDAVFTDIRAGYEKSFGLIFKDLANRVFSRVALADIYLD